MQKNRHKYRADVVIIGGGLAGIVTALELLDSGKRIIILDRDNISKFGGLARESFGGIFIVGTPDQKRLGINDSPEKALKDWCSFAEFGPQDVTQKLWAENYVNSSLKDIYYWLKNHSVKFFPIVHWVEKGFQKKGNSVPRFHMVWGTGKGLIEALVNALKKHPKKHNLSIYFGHQVDGITNTNGKVQGCFGVIPDKNESFIAEGNKIIVAAGGICGNLDLVKLNWHKDLGTPPDILLNGSHRYADGKLHEEVQRIGGILTHLDKQWNYAAGIHHPTPDRHFHGLSLVPPKSALWTTFDGKRFEPNPLVTGTDTRFLVSEICKQSQKYSWMILNWKIAKKELAVSGAEFNEAIRDKKLIRFLRNILFGNPKLVKKITNDCKDVVVASSIEELVIKMNNLTENSHIDPHKLEEEVRRFDHMLENRDKHDSDLQISELKKARSYRWERARVSRFQKILDKKAFPLIAIRAFILTRKSLGGIQTDLESRVLNTVGEPIEGLYAVGEAAGFGGGGIHGLRALEGTFLGSCILTGQAAARSIIGKKR